MAFWASQDSERSSALAAFSSRALRDSSMRIETGLAMEYPGLVAICITMYVACAIVKWLMACPGLDLPKHPPLAGSHNLCDAPDTAG